MEHKYTYYIVEGDGPVKAGIDQYSKEYRAFKIHANDIADKYGVKNIYQSRTGIIGLLFENENDVPEGLRHKKSHPENVYAPDKRTKAGKAIAKEFGAVTRPDIHTISRIAKTNPICVLDHRSRTGVALSWPTFEVIGETFIWRVPVQSPDHTDAMTNPAMTDFTGLREIKVSEYWEMKEAAQKKSA